MHEDLHAHSSMRSYIDQHSIHYNVLHVHIHTHTYLRHTHTHIHTHVPIHWNKTLATSPVTDEREVTLNQSNDVLEAGVNVPVRVNTKLKHYSATNPGTNMYVICVNYHGGVAAARERCVQNNVSEILIINN